MNTDFDRHFAADVWEKYALGMLPEKDCESLEEHLLICSKCQDLLAEADEYIHVMRAALTAMPAAGDKEPSHPEDDTMVRKQAMVRKQVKMSAVLAGAFSLMWLQ